MALAGLIMTSCSEDNDPFSRDASQVEVAERQLTFLFPGTAQGVVPYSATASGAENELKTLDIYVFGEDTTSAAPIRPMVLEEIFRSGEGYVLTPAASDYTAAISVPAGNNKSFFFVANGREHLSLDSLVLHETDTLLFKQKMSNTLKGHIACPMLMSAQVDMPDVATVLSGGNRVDVTLNRRMARFDILNNSETSGFVIYSVVLDSVPVNVPLFPVDSYEAPLAGDFPVIDFTTMANSNAGETNSVFYLYPTTRTDGNGLTLALAGRDLATNAPRVLPVVFKNYIAAGVDDPYIAIEANNRYLVQVEDMGFGELDATLRVLEWVSGDTVNVNTGDGTIKLNVTAPGVAFAGNTLTVAAEPTLNDSTVIGVAADGEWRLVVDKASEDWIGVSEVPAGQVQKEFKVTTLLPNPSSTEARQGVVMVQNVRRPSICQPLIVRQVSQDRATGRFLDLTGASVAGNFLSFSGEKTDSLNVRVDAPAGTGWIATKGTSATWFVFGNESGLRAATPGGASFEGNGTGTFSIVPQANTTENERIDTVTVTITRGGSYETDLVQKLIVRQAARNLGSIQLTCIGLNNNDGSYSVNIPATGFADQNTDIAAGHTGERQVRVKATTEWRVVIPEEATWLALQPVNESDYTLDAGTFNGYFMLKASAQSPGAEARSATVRVENTQDDSIGMAITFTQAAGEEEVTGE